MGARIAVVIVLSTLFSYLHMFHTLRTEALDTLERHVAERATREEAIFKLAEDNHAAFNRALEESIRALPQEEVNARFERLFVRLPDGSIRNRPEGFDGTRQVGLFVPRGIPVDDWMRRRLVAGYEVLSQYGPAFLVRFKDTFITLAEQPGLIYWPERPTYSQEAPADASVANAEYFLSSLPENNPRRETRWTSVYKEQVSGKWVTVATTPLDMDGQYVASVSHDILLEELMARTLGDHLPSAYNVIFREDGQIIAHPELDLKRAPGQSSAEAQQVHLRGILERMKTREGHDAFALPEYGEYVAVAQMHGTGWFFATIQPEHVVTQGALSAARIVLLLGVLSLVLELAIVSWVLREQITRPLIGITQTTARIAAGEFKVELDTQRQDELGQLARAFRVMADRIQHREEELRVANDGLEQRVEERTRELKEVHQQLVQTARRTGMAEIATNVLHNVGNVLNSVYTSSQVAKERVTEMRLEQVTRVATMLQERQSDLASFLQDERGRHLLPFLNKLGQNLVDERREVISLLDDVGRYSEHIGEIVKVQQDYARLPKVQEPVLLTQLVEDSLRINSAGLSRHQVKLERQLESLPQVLTDKHKLLMILVNLVSNAKYAMDHVPVSERLLRIKLERATHDQVRIELHDNGMGIAPEMLTRIFQFGFTTRAEGHGFGLHSSALAAQELGGTLAVHSDGPGKGATFTLEIPYHPVQEGT
ncbi:ATP-binding protein [Cystobacter ferrugineus]|uniref:histidine kinase n=1 Tax=Cystobacter ferrugineus TaxID=83449 RepID=A0A1L9BKC1_9BACT|nr:ATP-binding protein [Cystobacter ferrugineus]OJH42646.1 histidine kinase [Cystobacter ferrugineus]